MDLVGCGGGVGAVFADAVEDAVNEFSGIRGAVFFGDFDGLVDGDGGWSVRAIEDFVGPDAEDISIDGGESVELEIFRVFANHLVDVLAVGHPALEELVAEAASTGAEASHLVEFLEGRVGFVAMDFALVEILDRSFAGIASDSHG
jgi:hypothetical protein